MFFYLSILNIGVHAQIPVLEIIKGASVKVIKAVDLMVQRWQTETIWLQNAQQELENIPHDTRLKEIGERAERQRLYAGCFDALARVKAVITQCHRVKTIVSLQGKMVREYRGAIALFRTTRIFLRKRSITSSRYMRESCEKVCGTWSECRS